MLLAVAAAAGGLLGGADGPAGDGPVGGGEGRSRVTRVVDGDTVVLATLGRSRLIGVDTPEVHGSPECFGAQASAFAKRMLAGRRVRYAFGVERRDRYGRALIYLWLADGRLFNELLVARGYARALPIKPNVRFAQRLSQSAQRARGAARGLWSCP